MTVVAQPIGVARRVAAAGQRFYVNMAAACLAVAVLGFAPTYWIPMMQGTLNVSPITHLHGLFFYGWTALYLAQAWLVRERRLTRHRELGVIGVSLATGMCFVGLAAAIGTLKKFEPTPMADAARAFSVIPVTGIVFFVHRVYWIAGGSLLAIQFLRIPLSATGAWSRAAEFLVALSP